MDLGGPPRLFTVGSIVADIRLEAPHLPVRGGDVIASSARISAGGGFNILCAAARQGLRCVFAGRHGAGPYGERIRAELLREGVSVVHRARARRRQRLLHRSGRAGRRANLRHQPRRRGPISRGGASRICRSRPATRFSPPATIWPILSLARRSRPGWLRRRAASALSSTPARWPPIFRKMSWRSSCLASRSGR